MELAIPDLISNSYFPALAAAELGYFQREELDVSVELIFPVDRAYEALRDGEIAWHRSRRSRGAKGPAYRRCTLG